ncbi:hypothetical protein HK104_001955 [Borealophlyctis nickersoniae]|nr:hypothetical protein HK104_001955 [Borealophlyctis nickersoniae]
MSEAAGVIQFLHIIEKLKTTKRTGWVEHRIEGPESIADHMHRMGVMSLLIPESPDLSKSRILRIAIVHDLAEAIAGDITPHSHITKDQKHELERNAMDEMVRVLGESMEANEIKALWEEYETGQTEEAKVVKDLDKFEMICQAVEYEKRAFSGCLYGRIVGPLVLPSHLMIMTTGNEGKRLDSFFASTYGKFQNPTVKQWVEALYRERGCPIPVPLASSSPNPVTPAPDGPSISQS